MGRILDKVRDKRVVGSFMKRSLHKLLNQWFTMKLVLAILVFYWNSIKLFQFAKNYLMDFDVHTFSITIIEYKSPLSPQTFDMLFKWTPALPFSLNLVNLIPQVSFFFINLKV